MNTEEPTKRRRVNRRYSAKDRLRLISEHAASGLTKKAFCKQRGVNVGTFMGWRNLPVPKHQKPAFAKVDVPASTPPAAVEILLPNGVRVGIRHEGKQSDLIALVRGVSGAA